ncbi:hypothetical protein GCM10025867_51020 (plasmid) [Frondihabitans sucicola]|uniref:Uncharacterized protein n=1 Tax=Frondihabitans sucicola TaxID=1268041 RepID=A0ABM8GWJ2_9MICO|nr:hypothetical protein [Frondihabitans sucicola]BDZ52295.1 hypothetical protein GCM10025867_45360 [Frondihabitans sucicola]BDZ52861.1 hypothetical protein GCM10025867_51020 [Frondihabitans sucicola]
MTAHRDPSVPSAYDLNGQHAADVLMGAQALHLDANLHGDPPPTRNQVAAVLHGLANFGLASHMLSPEVAALGADKLDPLGEDFARATGVGRYLKGLGHWLETYPDDTSLGE